MLYSTIGIIFNSTYRYASPLSNDSKSCFYSQTLVLGENGHYDENIVTAFLLINLRIHAIIEISIDHLG